jgi:phage terminase small subunit
MVTTLNPRQLLFAQNVVSGMSLTDAYREAGYTGSGHVAHAGASKLMQKPAVAAFVDEQSQTATRSAIADRREILSKLTQVLRSDASDLDESGLPIHEVSRRTTIKSDGTRIVRVRSKSMSKHAALKQLARMLGLKNPASTDRDEVYRQRDIASARAAVSESIAALPETPAPPPSESSIHHVGRNLNSRQRLFCEYLSRDVPAAKAYHYAGYAGFDLSYDLSAAANRLLKRPAIAAYLRELREHTSGDPMGDLANRDETLSYLTRALRATRLEIETAGIFIDQVIQDEIQLANGDAESRTWVKSISQPRIMTQLLDLLESEPGQEIEDEHTRLARAEVAAMFATPQPILPTPEECAAM